MASSNKSWMPFWHLYDCMPGLIKLSSRDPAGLTEENPEIFLTFSWVKRTQENTRKKVRDNTRKFSWHFPQIGQLGMAFINPGNLMNVKKVTVLSLPHWWECSNTFYHWFLYFHSVLNTCPPDLNAWYSGTLPIHFSDILNLVSIRWIDFAE